MKGLTLVASEYCIENYLTIRKRVALFLPISVLATVVILSHFSTELYSQFSTVFVKFRTDL